ncbi:replication factor C small subunit [Candidatus Woesearchaeota archaeon CG11_big_fil_rev_8_21_14_0_20_43_8]|nr:MAG: replication factor C small subunit [Candidatus Woesearchaeota archaeon CG11_big_fil_rev_8_21_14_0_20_43_8]PIO07057.1 MAG: replication factor C small subunit [Candidatus Woesearchaeota archaeon CG08_land_8_20_14_0_20_43_7]
MHAIWTEKYRPRTFDEIKGQEDIIDKIKAFVQTKNMPHLLFAGPAGIGKTTTALVVANEFFKDSWRSNFLELNASDERGIDVVRNKVKDFARTRTLGDFPFKIIYLDECDALTKDAQHALRRTMENYTKTCRFILSCNYSSKIIDPIQSRCAVFKFKPLAKDHIFSIIDVIIERESLIVSDTVKDAIFEASSGDCRRVENILQSCAALGKTITEDNVFSMASIAKPKEIAEALSLAVRGDFEEARKKTLKIMLNYGLSGVDLIKQIQRETMKLDINDREKMRLIDKCGEIEFRMVEGSDEFLQIQALLSQFGLCKA